MDGTAYESGRQRRGRAMTYSRVLVMVLAVYAAAMMVKVVRYCGRTR